MNMGKGIPTRMPLKQSCSEEGLINSLSSKRETHMNSLCTRLPMPFLNTAIDSIYDQFQYAAFNLLDATKCETTPESTSVSLCCVRPHAAISRDKSQDKREMGI
jgi:hypothetical protein